MTSTMAPSTRSTACSSAPASACPRTSTTSSSRKQQAAVAGINRRRGRGRGGQASGGGEQAVHRGHGSPPTSSSPTGPTRSGRGSAAARCSLLTCSGPPPPLPQDCALAPRHAAPWRDPPCPAPVREERSCQEIPRPREAAPVLPAPPRQDRARLQRRRADLIKTKLHLQGGPRQPRPATAPSPPSCVASPGQASSSPICLPATTAPPILRSSCSSTS